MDTFDKRTGAAILTARGGRSQQSIADAMRDRGHKWSQSTVWGVEAGERPLKLAEASDLSQILGVTINDLSADPLELEATLLIRRQGDARRNVVGAVGAFFDVQVEIEALIERVEAGVIELPETTLATLREMATELVEKAVDDAKYANYQRMEHGHYDDDVAEALYAQDRIDWERGK